jgi:hypothetical protein
LRKLVIFTLAGAEVAALVYLATITWLLAGWFLDDAVAARMSENNWYRLAVLRVLASCLAALIAGSLIYAVNRFVAVRIGYESSRLPLRSATAFGLVVALAGIAGAVQFAIEKPFM